MLMAFCYPTFAGYGKLKFRPDLATMGFYLVSCNEAMLWHLAFSFNYSFIRTLTVSYVGKMVLLMEKAYWHIICNYL